MIASVPHMMMAIKGKNSRLRTRCLNTLGWMIRNYGVSILQFPDYYLKEMAEFISDGDDAVRNGALNAITEAFLQVSLVTLM